MGGGRSFIEILWGEWVIWGNAGWVFYIEILRGEWMIREVVGKEKMKETSLKASLKL